MNWLNAVDNILDGAFAPGQETDDETNSHYGSSVTSNDNLNESGTWTDDEDDSEHHPRLAFSMSEDVIDEENEEELREEVEDEKEAKSLAKPASARPVSRPVPGMVRPGNIRVMHKRSISSSSSEEGESGSEKPPKNQESTKLAPIALTEQDSLLKKQPEPEVIGNNKQDSAQEALDDTKIEPLQKASITSAKNVQKPLQSEFIKRAIASDSFPEKPSQEKHPNMAEDRSDDAIQKEETPVLQDGVIPREETPMQPVSPDKAQQSDTFFTAQENKEKELIKGSSVDSIWTPTMHRVSPVKSQRNDVSGQYEALETTPVRANKEKDPINPNLAEGIRQKEEVPILPPVSPIKPKHSDTLDQHAALEFTPIQTNKRKDLNNSNLPEDNREKEEISMQPTSPLETQQIDAHDQYAAEEKTPVQDNKQSARKDVESVVDPAGSTEQKTPERETDNDVDDAVEAMSAELEQLRVLIEGTSTEDEQDSKLGSQQSAQMQLDSYPQSNSRPPNSSGSLVTDDSNNRVEPNRIDASEGVSGDHSDDDQFEDATHEESPQGSAVEQSQVDDVATQSPHIEEQLLEEENVADEMNAFKSGTTASVSPGLLDHDLDQQATAEWSETVDTSMEDRVFYANNRDAGYSRGIRHSEATLPAANLEETTGETMDMEEFSNGDENDDGHADDSSIDFDGISKSDQTAAKQNTVYRRDNTVANTGNTSAAVVEEDRASVLSPEKPDLVLGSSHFVVERALDSWEEDPNDFDIDPRAMNCYGAFHIRILRAQRLPCPVGSSVHASVSLLPWRGRFRSERRTTFVLDQESTSFDHGVCAQWDDRRGDASTTISLVHAYVSESTPIPTMKISIVVSPVKMLEFSMCSVTLPCDVLMKTPGKWKRGWFFADMQEKKNDGGNQLFSDEQTALVEVEAIFVPDDQSFGSSFVSIGQSQPVQDEDEDDSSEATNPAEVSPEVSTPAAANAMKKVDNLVATTKPHYLRAHKFWKPASCVLCSRGLMGWGKQSFRCEACGLDCCSDCRLHVDIQLPCGSEKATKVVDQLVQNKLTVTRFLETMAPVDESYEQKKRGLNSLASDGETSLTDTRSLGGTTHTARGDRGRVGVMKMNFARACVFANPLPAVTEPQEFLNHKGDLRAGDYYIRVCRSGTEGFARTRTIPSAGCLKLEESNEMRLDVLHYGVDFFIQVMDALTDKTVGTSVITTQGILQQQRDLMIDRGEMSILNVGKKPPVFKGKQRMVLELRTGVRSGVSTDYFVPVDSKSDQGEISGWVEITAGLQEDVKRLYGPTPYECPPRPPDALNPSLLNLHISRISDFLEDIGNLISIYRYAVSWKNPVLTGFSFLVFVSFTLRFNAEYVGSLPFLFLVLCMLPLAASRSVGTSKDRFVQEEAQEWIAAEKDIDVNYSLHRPVGTVNINVTKGRNIRSRDLGLAGNVGCRVYWDPLRCSSEKQKERVLQIDKSAATLHDIGSTDSKFTANPTWDKLNESDESRRLKQVLPHHGHFFETEEELAQESGFEFPVLQPFRKLDDEETGEQPHHINADLEPWKNSPGAIVFQIRFRDILNMLPGSDHIFGEVSIPLSMLVEKRELSGWFQVLDVGSKEFALVDDSHGKRMPEIIDDTSVVKGLAEAAFLGPDTPQVFLTLKWFPPEEALNTQESKETQREASFVIQEEFLRWAVVSRDKDKFKQYSLGAFKTVSGLAGTLQVIQNFLGKVADTIEMLRNLLNFTDPYKSSMILAAVALLWFILCLLPTRVVILIAGLAQYGLTLKKRLGKILKPRAGPEAHDNDDDASQASDLDDDEDDGSENAPLVWLKNAFLGLPTDEDLRKTYFWEGRRIGAKKRDNYANEKRLARLKRLWRAQWHATVKIRDVNVKGGRKGAWVWKTAFAVVQGRRFLWWNSVKDFDCGETPLGRIFLAGHAGLSGLSPLEMREIDPKEVPFVVGIFGRGLQDQQRLTLLLSNTELKEALEDAIIEASVKED